MVIILCWDDFGVWYFGRHKVFGVWVFYGACDYVRRLWCFDLQLCLWVFGVCLGFGFLVVMVFLSLTARTSLAMADGSLAMADGKRERERERAVEMRERELLR